MNITPVEPPCKLGWLDVRLPDEAIDKLNVYISNFIFLPDNQLVKTIRE